MAYQSDFKLAEKVYDTLREVSASGSSNGLGAKKLAERIVGNPRYRESCQDKLNSSENPLLKGRDIDEADSDLAYQVKKEIQGTMKKVIIKKYPALKINDKVYPRTFFYSEKIDKK